MSVKSEALKEAKRLKKVEELKRLNDSQKGVSELLSVLQAMSEANPDYVITGMENGKLTYAKIK